MAKAKKSKRNSEAKTSNEPDGQNFVTEEALQVHLQEWTQRFESLQGNLDGIDETIGVLDDSIRKLAESSGSSEVAIERLKHIEVEDLFRICLDAATKSILGSVPLTSLMNKPGVVEEHAKAVASVTAILYDAIVENLAIRRDQ